MFEDICKAWVFERITLTLLGIFKGKFKMIILFLSTTFKIGSALQEFTVAVT